MQWMRERLDREEGFTLIELMVVVLIIAVLVAIAVPSFLGFRTRAQDRAAQAMLRNTLVAEKGWWTDNGAYTDVEANLKTFEPTVRVTTNAIGTLTSTDPVGAYLLASSPDAICLVKVADSGNVFAIFDDSTAAGGTYYRMWDSTGTPACPTAVGSAPAGWSANGFPTAP